MLKFDVTNRFSGKVQFTAEIDCDDSAPTSTKLGLAVCWAFKTGAYLGGAYLRGAYLGGVDLGGADLRDADLRGADLDGADLRGVDLRGAYLRDADLHNADLDGADLDGAYLRGVDLGGADLRGAYLGAQWIVQGATRSDGCAFMLTNFKDEGVRVKADCRNFSIANARVHWQSTLGGTPLGDETMAILDNLEALARIRNLSMEPVA